MEYARWLVSNGKWQQHTDVFSRANDRGNSHSPRLGAYRRMLEAYEPIWRGVVRRGGRTDYLLTADELRQVAAAALHPSRRAGY
ncbi:YfbU family protein [Kribbella sp. NPDC023855]|uniref:YfbU family protein n=1 Tax=Kribbella sp. NPDC023855 TaxID=3154698 RepID=UPI00340F1289